MALLNKKTGIEQVGLEEIVPRDISFNLTKDNVKKHWFNGDPWNTMWLSSVLAAVPEGERWIMRSASLQFKKLENPEVHKAGIALCKQERTHAREHAKMNTLLIDKGLPLDKIEDTFVTIRDLMQKYLTPETQGALAASGEHFTAILASLFLEHPRVLKDTHPEIVSMMYWHFVEESEHKAGSYDVFTHASGDGTVAYLRRIAAMATFTAVGIPAFGVATGYLLWKDKELTNIPSAIRMFDTLFYRPGLLRRFAKLYLPFYKPGFHPWEDDNRELIHVWKTAFEKTGDPRHAYEVLCERIEADKSQKTSQSSKSKRYAPGKLALSGV